MTDLKQAAPRHSEIEQLKAERDTAVRELKLTTDERNRALRAWLQEKGLLGAAEAERDALKADAERYRYLRIHCYRYKYPNNEHDRAMHLSFTVSGIWANNHDPEVLDGCIDTAREVKP